LALVVALVVMLCAVTGGAVLVADSGSPAVVIQSPSRANSTLYAAALASGSFHYVDVSSATVEGHTITVTQSGDAGHDEGVQYMTSALGDGEVVVINSHAYMKANLAALENTFGYSPSLAAPYVNRWISFTSSDAPYTAVAADVTNGTTWNDPSDSPTDFLPQMPESVSGLSQSNGETVQSVRYALRGSSKTVNASYTGTETISFSASDPHLPTQLTEHLSGTANQQPSTESNTVTFTQWGESVDVTAPSASIPYASLPGASTTS